MEKNILEIGKSYGDNPVKIGKNLFKFERTDLCGGDLFT